MNLRAIAAPPNRGILLDAVVFVLNLLLVRGLARSFVDLARSASGGDAAAKLSLTVFFVAIFVLPAAGAVLKRWHFHQQRGAARGAATLGEGALGCLLHPVLYFTVSLVVGMAAGVLLATRVFGEGFAQRAGIFLPLMLAVLVLSMVQTVLVYRYFSPPRKPPRGAFWRDGRSAFLGDLCIFVNMALFQVLWNVALSGRFQPVSDAEELAGRLLLVAFLSVLLYLPPRIFYLADDAHRPASRLSMLLAVSPVVLHVVLGVI